MNESEINALFDAHDALVKAYLDANLTFAVFVSAYDGFPHNYALDRHEAVALDERTKLPPFRKRIAFHLRVAGILSCVCSDEDNANPLYAEAGRFVPAVGLMRLRELVARHPSYQVGADRGG